MSARRPRPSFEETYEELVSRVYAFFAYRLGNRHEAEDLTQATFERALRAWPRFDPERAAPATWVLTIARNLLIDHHRAAHTTEQFTEADQAGVVQGPEQALGMDPRLEHALERLGSRERELVALRFGGDLSGPEIAAVTGSSLASVQQMLSRALRKLREDLESTSVDDT